MGFSFSTFLLFWQDIFSLDIITSSFSLHKLVFTQARVTVLLSDTSLVIIKQQWKSARNRTRGNIKKPSKPASTHAPISPTVCDQRFNWNCSQESTGKSILFTHKYPPMVMNLLFSQLRQSAINFPMHNCLFFSPHKINGTAQIKCLGCASRDAKQQHCQRPSFSKLRELALSGQNQFLQRTMLIHGVLLVHF